LDNCSIEVLKKNILPYNYKEITKVIGIYVIGEDIDLKSVIFLTNGSTKYTVEAIHFWLFQRGGKVITVCQAEM